MNLVRAKMDLEPRPRPKSWITCPFPSPPCSFSHGGSVRVSLCNAARSFDQAQQVHRVAGVGRTPVELSRRELGVLQLVCWTCPEECGARPGRRETEHRRGTDAFPPARASYADVAHPFASVSRPVEPRLQVIALGLTRSGRRLERRMGRSLDGWSRFVQQRRERGEQTPCLGESGRGWQNDDGCRCAFSNDPVCACSTSECRPRASRTWRNRLAGVAAQVDPHL